MSYSERACAAARTRGNNFIDRLQHHARAHSLPVRRALAAVAADRQTDRRQCSRRSSSIAGMERTEAHSQSM